MITGCRWLVVFAWLLITAQGMAADNLKLALSYEATDPQGPELERALARRQILLTRLEDADIVVSVGARHFYQALTGPRNKPLIAVQLSHEAVQLVLTKSQVRLDQTTLMILRDPPVQRQLQLIRTLLPKAKKVGFLCLAACSESRQLAADMGFEWVSQMMLPESALTAELALLLPKVEVILAFEDKRIYNPQSLKALLLTSYRHQRVIIGSTPAYVTAGSLATTFADADDLARQIDESLRFYQQKLVWPAGSESRYFHVAINQQVALSLGLQLPTPEQTRQLMLQESTHAN